MNLNNVIKITKKDSFKSDDYLFCEYPKSDIMLEVRIISFNKKGVNAWSNHHEQIIELTWKEILTMYKQK